MHKSSVRFRFGSVWQKKIGDSVRFGFGKKFLVRSFPSEQGAGVCGVFGVGRWCLWCVWCAELVFVVCLDAGSWCLWCVWCGELVVVVCGELVCVVCLVRGAGGCGVFGAGSWCLSCV